MILAVDAGGSTCRVALVTGGARYDATLGAANVTSDFDGAVATILSGMTEVARAAGLSVSELAPCPAHLALAGVTGAETAARVAAALPLSHAVIEDDTRAAVVGALGGRDGCVAGIGTGSFLARQAGGTVRMIGGRGLILGDEASAAWLGREALSATLHAEDGLRPHSRLTSALLAELGGSAGIIAFAASAAPQDFGRLAPRVTSAGEDDTSADLMRRGAEYVARGFAALGRVQGEPVCLIGGVAQSYLPWLPEDLHASLVPARGSGLDGAIALAAQADGPASHAPARSG